MQTNILTTAIHGDIQIENNQSIIMGSWQILPTYIHKDTRLIVR